MLRLNVREGVFNPMGGCCCSPPPPPPMELKNVSSPPIDRSLNGGPCLPPPPLLPLLLLLPPPPPPPIGAGRADPEADQAATAEIAVAADFDSRVLRGVVKGRAETALLLRGESNVDSVSHVERRALRQQREEKSTGAGGRGRTQEDGFRFRQAFVVEWHGGAVDIEATPRIGKLALLAETKAVEYESASKSQTQGR